MKKQDIRNAYTAKVKELLNQGYTIYPDSMGGSQGEIAHIDLTDGKDIYRVLLNRDHRWERDEDGYIGDTITLTVGKAAPDTRIFGNWDDLVWNNRLEPCFQIEWAVLGKGRDPWYTGLEEGRRCQRIQFERYRRRNAGAHEKRRSQISGAEVAEETAQDEDLQAGRHRDNDPGLERRRKETLRNRRQRQAVHHPLSRTVPPGRRFRLRAFKSGKPSPGATGS